VLVAPSAMRLVTAQLAADTNGEKQVGRVVQFETELEVQTLGPRLERHAFPLLHAPPAVPAWQWRSWHGKRNQV